MLQWFQFECYKYLEIILRRQNSACVANIWVPSLQTFYLNCVTPVASRAAGGHGGKHRNLPIFASARFSSSPSSIFLPQPNFLFSPSSIFLLDIDLIFIHLSFLRPGPANLEASYPSYLRSSWLYFCPCPFFSFYRAKCHMARSFETDTIASHCSKLVSPELDTRASGDLFWLLWSGVNDYFSIHTQSDRSNPCIWKLSKSRQSKVVGEKMFASIIASPFHPWAIDQ